MPGLSPDHFEDAEAPTAPSSPYSRSALDRLSFTLKLREKGFRDTALLRAFELVPRESFAPRRYADLARRDVSLPLSCGQTMTAPLILARLLQVAGVEPHHRVLDVGTGSGYLAAVLSHLAADVTSVERFRSLALEAEGKTRGLGLANIAILHADGLAGLDRGRFDRILVDGRMEDWPYALCEALTPQGRIVACFGARGAGRLAARHGDGRTDAFEPLDLPPLRLGLSTAL